MSQEWGNASLDRVFKALSNPVRRHILYYLQEHGDASLSELAAAVVGWKTTTTGEYIADATDHEEMYAMLYHTHLPKLATTGVVRYNRDRAHVELTELPQFVESLLSVSMDAESADLEAIPEDYPDVEY